MSPRKSAGKSQGFTAEERTAMRERARELRSDGGESDVLAKISEMAESDRAMATRLHAIIRAAAPSLSQNQGHGRAPYA